MQQRAASVPAILMAGILAGLVGAVSIDAYLLVTVVSLAHAVSATTFYQYVASGAIGKAAYARAGSAYLGVAVHLVVSIAWGIGYAYVAGRTPQVRARPLLSAIAFGVVVMLAMQLVEVAANIYALPSSLALLNLLVAHVVFYAIPVAFVVDERLGWSSRTRQRRTGA